MIDSYWAAARRSWSEGRDELMDPKEQEPSNKRTYHRQNSTATRVSFTTTAKRTFYCITVDYTRRRIGVVVLMMLLTYYWH